ncbi:MAG: alkaline phosphatase D [Cyclobacteriaceae bacterium]|jgi:alkaline phosphatase D
MNRFNACLFTSIVGIVLTQLTGCKSENKTESVTEIDGPYFATGVKVGEVNQTEAIIWTRLTKASQRVSSDSPMPTISYKDTSTGEWKNKIKGRADMEVKVEYPEGFDVSNIEGAASGSEGEVQIKYAIDGKQWKNTPWMKVDPSRDYSQQTSLSGLKAGSEYAFEVQARPVGSEVISATIKGKFKTAPPINEVKPVTFTVTTGTSYNDVDSTDFGYKIYDQMLKLNPDFFVHTGDILYYDRQGKTFDLALWHWDRMYSLPANVNFHRQVSSYFIKDDHDTWMNDSWPTRQTKFMGDFTFKQGLKIFRDEVPMGEKTYRTRRWGKDLQVWFVEGRDFRSANNMEDGPDKTIWGTEQMEWFKSTVDASDATFKILVSPTPVVGPDRGKKNDNHANEGFQYEGDIVRKFIATQPNMYIVCGDRHWQYVSKDADSGTMEFSCGPGSNEHAGGWKQEDLRPEHIYLNVTGGFLSVNVTREADKPVAIFSHIGVDGKLLNEQKVEAE